MSLMSSQCSTLSIFVVLNGACLICAVVGNALEKCCCSLKKILEFYFFNPAGDHWAEFGPRDQCKSCAGRNSAGFGMTL